MLSAKAARQHLDLVMGLCKKLAPEAEAQASLTAGRVANTRFARSEITSTGDVTESVLSLTVAFGKREASVSTNQLDETSLHAAVEKAAGLARLSPEDPERMPVLGAQKLATVKAAFDEGTAALGAEQRATAAAAAIAAGEQEKLEVAGFYEHRAGSWSLASSAGLFAHHVSTRAEFTSTCRTGDGTGSGWAGLWSPRAADLNTGALAKSAALKAARSAKPRKLEPGRYTVVLEPAAVAELVGFLTGALDQRRADEGRSFFAKAGGGTRLGDKLFPASISLTSDPASTLTPSAPFSGDGLPLAPTTWVDKGTLGALSCSRFWARKQGRKPLPQAPMLLGGGAAASIDALVAGVKRGVLITRFWYTRWVDPRTILITGLTRDGVFLIEDGAITAPVNNFRFNESPVQMLAQCDALTKETWHTPAGAARVPALRTHEFNLASISDAV